MSRNKIIISTIIVLLLAGAVVYFSLLSNRGTVEGYTPEDGIENTQPEAVESSPKESSTDASASEIVETEPANSPEPLKTEDIEISNNSPEYDLKMSLIEYTGGKTALELEYYYDGTGMSRIFDSEVIPEIDGIFGKRADNTSGSKVFTIENAFLNPKLGKVYFIINGDGVSEFLISDMYVISLSDASVKKVFSNRGKYGGMHFSRDYKYLAYSYEDLPESSVLQESTLLELIDCNKDELIIKNSRLKDRKIGSNMKQEQVYDYTFKAWQSSAVIRLLQIPVTDGEARETEVLYDISRDLMLNKDGTLINTDDKTPDATTDNNTEATETQKPATEITALNTLKDFYSNLAVESDYPKAMGLLDESFTIELAIFKQFGITKLTKADISAEDAAIYGEMLRAASFDTVVSEEINEAVITIYYYQNFELNQDNQVRQAMTAYLKKTEKGFKITMLKDADETKPPFTSAE